MSCTIFCVFMSFTLLHKTEVTCYTSRSKVKGSKRYYPKYASHKDNTMTIFLYLVMYFLKVKLKEMCFPKCGPQGCQHTRALSIPCVLVAERSLSERQCNALPVHSLASPPLNAEYCWEVSKRRSGLSAARRAALSHRPAARTVCRLHTGVCETR